MTTAQPTLPVDIAIPFGPGPGRLVTVSLRGPDGSPWALEGAMTGLTVTADGPIDERGDGGVVVVLPPVEAGRSATLYAGRPASAPPGVVRVRVGGDTAVEAARVLDIVCASIATLECIRSGVARFPDQTETTRRCLSDLGALVDRGTRLGAAAEEVLSSRLWNAARIGQPLVDATDLVIGYGVLARRLASSFPTWGLSSHLARTYMHVIVPSGHERTAGPCDRCGSPRFDLDYRHRTLQGVSRRLTHCARCGIASDIPDEPGTPIWITAPAAVSPGITPVEVAVSNPHPFAVQCSVAGFISHIGGESGAAIPETSGILLPVGGTGIATLLLEVDDRPLPGVYELVVVASSLLELQLAARPLRINASGS